MRGESLGPDVVAFEQKLAAAAPPQEDRNNIVKSYNPKTVAELSKLLPQVTWHNVISKLAPSAYSADYVIVNSPSYTKGLAAAVSGTSRETLQAYLVWKTIQAYEDRVEDLALEPLKRFNKKLRGVDPDAKEDRWRTCIRSTDHDLGWILSKFFVDVAFSAESKTFGDQIVSDIKGSFIGSLKDAKWMSKEVRELGIKKVHAIDQKIGYPTSNPDVMDPEALKKYYEDVNIANTTHFNNTLEATRLQVQRLWSKLGKPTRDDEWDMTVPTVNAYYNPAGNEIVFPAGIMQNPVFHHPSVPQYLTYGAFGAVAGHELSHGMPLSPPSASGMD